MSRPIKRGGRLQFSQAREAYVRWLLATKDLSPHTLRAYQGDLSSFEASLDVGIQVDELDRAALVEFLETQKASGLSPASLRRRASALRGFSRWLLAQDLISADPWIGASVAVGRARRLPRVLPPRELDRLLAFLKQTAGVNTGSVNAQLVEKRPHESTTLLAVALMVATGVRVHEVVGFRHQDIDLSSRAIRLVGKGRRERQVFLTNDWITDLTESYLQARSKLDLPHSRLLFNLHYEPLTTAAMRSRLAKAARAAGITQRVTPHMLRHTAATQLIEAGVDIRYIQRLLGHASLSTTEIYTHVSDRALKRVVSEADVLGRLVGAR
ncbi:MAG TPA: tyrosine-type recombinase/integrase [Solirubrobacterales bacterium]|nr:tyrosine-type recombinase/integrase [Solirubrobacterales bacterium]